MGINLDFSGDNAVKPLPQLAQGDYRLTITSWKNFEPQKAETKSKGMNLRVKFKLSDPIQVDEKTGEDAEFTMEFNDQIFYMFDNPFAIAPLLCAVKGIVIDTDHPEESFKQLGNIDMEDESEWIGEEVMGRLKRTPAADGSNKSYMNPISDAYTPVD